MQWNALIGLSLGMLAASTQIGPPPVVLDLGPLKPTPVPTARQADKKRLISTITVQNNAKGETVISFEAMDVAAEGDEKFPLIAAKSYSLSDAEARENPRAREIAERIVGQVRQLERDMLRYAEVVGPPREREPLTK